MPNCRHCASRIEKFNKDRCPICGEINPLLDVNTDTIGVTSSIGKDSLDYSSLKLKKKSTFCVLLFFIGWTGLPFYYLGKYKTGLLHFFWSIVLFGLCFATSYFLIKMDIMWSCIIGAAAIYIFYLITMIYFLKTTLKDSKENIVR